MMQSPSHRDYAGLYVVRLSDLAQYFDEAQITAQTRFVKLHSSPPPVVLRKGSNTFCGHLSGKQTGNHWGIADDADVIFLSEGQNLLFHCAPQHGIRGLKTGNR